MPMTDLTTILPDVDLQLADRGGRVVVAMSGGVDSSVAAALVKRAGYDAVGITLQLYDHGEAIARKGACCAGRDIHDARRVATALDMPHYVLDYESQFRAEVIEDFADSYLAGHTPIPCVKCNETVKFRDLVAMARDLDAHSLVTGHYIESRAGAYGREMYRPIDEARDQSYFLYSTTRAQLDFLRFPLAHFTKDEIRDMAGRLGLPVANKPDSQDICFVPNGDYAGVIERLRPDCALPGRIVDMQGNVLGQHQGVLHYTIGQRRGLGVAIGDPLYVVRIDAEAREVVVGPREALMQSEIRLEAVNWLGAPDIYEAQLRARIRSAGTLHSARLVRTDDAQARVVLDTPEEGIAPGQACVFYGADNGQVLGGGRIVA